MQSLINRVLALPNVVMEDEIRDLVHPDLVNGIVALASRGIEGNPRRISRQTFVDMVAGMSVSAFATIGNLTVAKDSELIKPKRNGTSGRISKLAVSQVVVNGSYGNMVTGRMGGECEPGETIGDHFGIDRFEPEERSWGQRVMVDGRPVGLVEHKGVLYLETAKIRNIGPVYWFMDDNEVEWADIKDHFHPFRGESQRQPLPEERKIKWRTWKMESILTVSITPNTSPRVCSKFILFDKDPLI